MRINSLRSICTFAVISLLVSGCKSNSNQINPNQGFTIQTQEALQTSLGYYGPPVPLPNTYVYGNFQSPMNGLVVGGNVTYYEVSTNINGIYYVSNGEAPAWWDHVVYIPSYCAQYANPPITFVGTTPLSGSNIFEVYNYPTANLETITWTCGVEGNDFPEASSRFAIAGAIPSSVTLSAQAPFTTTYGMPMLYVYSGSNGSQTLDYQITAMSVSSDSSSATFPLPSSLPQNGYGFITVNAAEGGGFEPNSFNYYSVASSQTIAGNPFGVAALFSSTSWQSAYNPDPYGDGTCQGQWQYNSGTYTNSSPIVTLYSLNQVNNGGATIPVGTNPTAIVIYDSQDNRDDENDGPCQSYRSDTTQMTRAVVANSGSNTVSVLDIVNNAVLSTITVGNQPVALAVSSDGSTAYVANYTDGTVTQVNLTTGTVTATIAVGTQPTSVALTSAGILWVGGVGFLTELNANPMSVIATQPVTGKSIIALGYSDSVKQLVATTVDTSGNVYADEINPSTVQTGGVYTPLASNMVSSVGTYGTVRAYTATLAGANRGNGNLLNINQVGAPPLVVQDGWAVVTATPTGFTITDITGQVVLVSETTPSPVTAIAVDS
jgi:YVTN family beta-propeller protein